MKFILDYIAGFFEANPVLAILLIYFVIISLISIIVCIYDKVISKKDRVELRIPEKTLMILSAIGGGAAMYITMLLIRHKTKHAKFMLGIPIFIAIHAVIVYLLIHYGIL